MNKKVVKRHDPMSAEQRSLQMAKVRGTKNRSTEMRVAAYLIRYGFRGWKRHTKLPGRPDFCFVRKRVAIFVDGCFWHGCPRCRRNLPHSRREFWRHKIDSNRRRDRKIERVLHAQGYSVFRVWEHALSGKRWLSRLRLILKGLRQGRGNNFT